VPAYHAAAEAVLGASGFELLARAFQGARASMASSAERLLSGWLAQAGVTPARRS